MKNLLYLIAFLLILSWSIGVFIFDASNFIHLLLTFALITFLVKQIQVNDSMK